MISGTASTAGTYTLTVKGTDSSGPSGSATFTWTIGSGGGNTVTVTNPGNQNGTVGTAASLQINATDSAAGQTLTYSAAGLPAGLSINSTTGLITGTPTTAGHNVTVTATDTTGASGSAAFTWDIGAAAAAPLRSCWATPASKPAPRHHGPRLRRDQRHSKEPPHTGNGTPGWTATATPPPTPCPRPFPSRAAAAATS